MSKPLGIDLFCGLGGFTEGMLAEGYECVGFDIEQHNYGDGARYPAQLVLQDVLTIHGRQFKDAALIVASPPCQCFSYMAMPWSKAKAIEADYKAGRRDVKQLTALFDACFRIQREACEAAGRHIPMVVENVRGAQKWVGRSAWNFGSFHLWGDVPALMPIAATRETQKKPIDGTGDQLCAVRLDQISGYKMPAGTSTRTSKGRSAALGNYDQMREGIENGTKQGGDWFNSSQPSISRLTSSRSKARKAASAAIAKIPFQLASYIARVYFPRNESNQDSARSEVRAMEGSA